MIFRREELPLVTTWLVVLAWILAILFVLMFLAGAPFGGALEGFLTGAFGGRRSALLLTTFSRAALIVGMAISVLLSFRARLFNIGGEGQLVVGGLVAAVAGIYIPGPPVVVAAASICLGMAGGALWAVLAGLLQSVAGVPLLVGSLLLNYPARYVASYVVSYPLRDTGSGLLQSHQIPVETWLPFFPGTRLDIGIVFIAAATVFAIVYSHASVHGYKAKMMGLSVDFAEASGLQIRKLSIQTLAMSGAVAGLVGAVAVFGIHHRYVDGMLVQPLYAWTGIVAVLLVKLTPWAVPLSGFFFASLQTGAAGMERSAGVPKELAIVMQAVIILMVASRMTGLSFNGTHKNHGSDGGS